MSLRGWEADRQLTLEGARGIIGVRFPSIDSRELAYLGSGWEFDTYLTVDGWVFRFPRQAHCADLFEPERRVHRLVSGVLPPDVAIPSVEIVGEPALGFPYRFAGHRFIRGIAVDTIDPGLLPTLAVGLGAALRAIHTIPEEKARAAGVTERNVDEAARGAFFEHVVAVASKLSGLDPVIDHALSWVRQLSLPLLPLPRFEGPLRFNHQDLMPEHLLVDPTTGRLIGILDWTDVMLGDPARDFAELVAWGGWGFAEEVLSSYGLPVDEAFRKRLSFIARWLSVMWLALAQERGCNVAKRVEWVRNAYATGRPT